MDERLYTIGYSGFPETASFIDTLKDFGIQILIDVRSSPFSSFYESYNKDRLSLLLQENGIYYYNYARQFGARQENPAFFKNGRLDFEKFTKSSQFLEGVSQVERSNAKITFMCAEKHPADCHRTIMVAKALSDRGHKIIHILPGKETMTQKDVEEELVDMYFPKREQSSLFAEDNLSDEEYIARAYQLRNDEIGYKPGENET